MSSIEHSMIADLEIMAQANNYQNWMFRKIAPYVGQRILEVGAGIGNFTRLLLDRDLVVPTDLSALCVNKLQQRLSDGLHVQPRLLDLGNPSDDGWSGFQFDTIICLNVLEHVEDHLRALEFMHSVLEPGGRAVILVPAFQFLYGTIDAKIGHFRRYRRGKLLPVMREAGFTIEHSFYMNVIGIAGWFWNNRVRRIKEEDAEQIQVFDRYIAPWAEQLEKLIPPPLGLSLIAIGRK